MITSKSGNAGQRKAGSPYGLWFAPPVAVKPKRNAAKKKASAEVVVSAPAAQPEVVVTPEIAVTPSVDTAAEPVGADQARAA